VAGRDRQVPPVNGDQVRGTSFIVPRSRLSGYDADEVEDLLDAVAAELDAGRPAGPVIETATLPAPGEWSYDIDAVDWFFEQLARGPNDSKPTGLSSDPWAGLDVAQFTRSGAAEEPGSLRQDFSAECENAWYDFDQQPGVYLRWERVKGGWSATRWAFELRTADQQAIASLRGWPIYGSMTASTGGKTFTWNRKPARSSPDIAELAAYSWRDHAGHFTAKPVKDSAQRRGSRQVRELIDDTGTPTLYSSGDSFNYRAYARITFPDRRWLRFLVRGTGRGNAIMTAVDQAGNKVARYRITRITRFNQAMVEAEIAVHPDQRLTDELVLAIAVSPPWLYHYFDTPK
jgi:DivIVA domain-containing protein